MYNEITRKDGTAARCQKPILSVLAQAEKPLSYSEVKFRTCEALGRKHIDPKTIASNLVQLEKAQSAEKDLINDRIYWMLSGRLHLSSLMNSFQRLIKRRTSSSIGKILVNNMTMPHTVFLIPPPKDEFEVASQFGASVSVSWESPTSGIASTLFNLVDFLDFAISKRGTVKDLQTTVIVTLGGFTSAGEQLFDYMTKDLWERASSGFTAINHADVLQNFLPRHILVASDVWDEFIGSLLHSAKDTGVISQVKGNLEESKENLRKNLHQVSSLADLMKNRKIVAMYLWDFPEMDAEAERVFRFSDFDKWLEAVKTGYLGQRVWLFEDKTLTRVRRAFRLVRQSRTPHDFRIDKENWTLLDIYKYHPRGKDPKFWEEMLEALKSRNVPEHLQHRKEAVHEGIYSEFKKKEYAYVTDMLDKEEGSRSNA